jgi:hypothetical protein
MRHLVRIDLTHQDSIVNFRKRYPSPGDIPSNDVLVSEELARVTSQIVASRGKP